MPFKGTMAPQENNRVSSSHNAENGSSVDVPTSDPHDKKAGYCLRWSRLTKTVQVSSNTGGLIGNGSISQSLVKRQEDPTKTILDSVSGYAAPGELLSIMGPSGSGKTSLMNVLSGRSSYQGGVLSINGEAVTQHSMKRLMTKIAYVKQVCLYGHR